jgi:hypothetical protein
VLPELLDPEELTPEEEVLPPLAGTPESDVPVVEAPCEHPARHPNTQAAEREILGTALIMTTPLVRQLTARARPDLYRFTRHDHRAISRATVEDRLSTEELSHA